MKKVYILCATISLVLLAVVLTHTPQQAGDIVEYFGTTQSLLSHGGVNLTASDRIELEKVLHPGYFTDPQYYIAGRDGNRYPVHFVLYSLLAVPVRILLDMVGINPLLTLPLLNLVILTTTVFTLMLLLQQLSKTQVHLRGVQARFFTNLCLILFIYLSPLLSFLVWPGPDMLYMCLLILSVFLFFEHKTFLAACTVAVASWHSQPLAAMAVLYGLYFAFEQYKLQKREGKIPDAHTYWKLICVVVLVSIPYLYNLYAFGVLTPWTKFENGWTQLYGFGIHNASIQKLFEQFFDLNIGLFWYMPVLFALGLYGYVKEALKNKHAQFTGVVFLITAFLFQTNPAWHYGTAGYGPGRHALFAIAFFIYFGLVYIVTTKKSGYVLLALFIAAQLYVHSFNGWATPDFTKVLEHSPYAKLVLNKAPYLYNPTPEIFVDRTTHTDIDRPTSAVYMYDKTCKKAYVLASDRAMVENMCGNVPETYQGVLDNEFRRKANYRRVIKTSEATFWPDNASCGEGYKGPYICMKKLEDVAKETGITDISRIKTIPEFAFPGVWKMSFGKPVEIIVPPGYIIDYTSFKGAYINFQ